MLSGRDGGVKVNKIALFLIFLGLVITGADLVTLFKGVRLCSFEGCRLAQGSPYAHVFGVPLAAFGVVYFIISAPLALKNDRWLFYWSAVGAGASLYFIYLQGFVLGEVCLVCIAVEILIFLLFILSAIRGVSLFLTVLLVALAFLGLHALYTWGTLESDTGLDVQENVLLAKYYTTRATGCAGDEAVFFFDLDCPACLEALSGVRRWASARGIKVVFREVTIHSPESKALYLYSLLRRGVDPWAAIEEAERMREASGDLNVRGREEKLVRRLLVSNKLLLRGVGFEGVPALLIHRKGEVVGREGLKAVEGLFSLCDSQSQGDRIILENGHGALGAVCTPQRCR